MVPFVSSSLPRVHGHAPGAQLLEPSVKATEAMNIDEIENFQELR
jgi:hypothetical protein